jgi:arylsulfatase A-like enzyme
MGNNTVKKIVDNIPVKSQKEYVKKRFFDASASTLEQMKEKLDNAIVNVDNEIGRLYDYLEENKLLENTIFMIFADHGTTFGEHNIYFEHSGLYDESIHVPLIMKIPGIIPRRVNALTQSIDIAPTILDVLGDKKEIDGKSLLEVMKNGGEFRDKIFCVDTCSEKAFTVRNKKKKLIVSDSKGCYLCGAVHNDNFEEYDLENDPEERNNIYTGNSEFEKVADNINF